MDCVSPDNLWLPGVVLVVVGIVRWGPAVMTVMLAVGVDPHSSGLYFRTAFGKHANCREDRWYVISGHTP